MPSRCRSIAATVLCATTLAVVPFAGCGNDDLLGTRLSLAGLINAPAAVNVQTNIAYAERNGDSLKLDLYRPTSYLPVLQIANPVPFVVVIHGGSWKSGDKGDVAEFAYDLAAHGIAAASIEYRLVGRSGGTFPAPVVDTLDAIDFLRSKAADYNLDASRIGLMGVSAGGHLALMAGLPSDVSVFDPARTGPRPYTISAIVNIEGPTDFTADPATYSSRQIKLVEGFLGKTIAEDADGSLRRAASPVTYVRAGGPPVLTIHGTIDGTVPFNQAERLQAVLEAVGEPHQFHPVADMDHIPGAVWLGPWVQGYRGVYLDFLTTALGN